MPSRVDAGPVDFGRFLVVEGGGIEWDGLEGFEGLEAFEALER